MNFISQEKEKQQISGGEVGADRIMRSSRSKERGAVGRRRMRRSK
jgi:hypothetical protein